MESDNKNDQTATETKIVHQQKRKVATKKTVAVESNHEENHQPMKKLKSEILSHDENSNNADDIPTKKPVVRKKKVIEKVSQSINNEEQIKNDDNNKHEEYVSSQQLNETNEQLSKTPISIEVVDTMDIIDNIKTTSKKKILTIEEILKSYQQDDDDDEEEEHKDVFDVTTMMFNQNKEIEHNKKIFVFNDCDITLKIPYKSVLIMAMDENDAKNILLNYVNKTVAQKKKLTQIDIKTVPFIHDEKNTLCLD